MDVYRMVTDHSPPYFLAYISNMSRESVGRLRLMQSTLNVVSSIRGRTCLGKVVVCSGNRLASNTVVCVQVVILECSCIYAVKTLSEKPGCIRCVCSGTSEPSKAHRVHRRFFLWKNSALITQQLHKEHGLTVLWRSTTVDKCTRLKENILESYYVPSGLSTAFSWVSTIFAVLLPETRLRLSMSSPPKFCLEGRQMRRNFTEMIYLYSLKYSVMTLTI